MLKNKELQVLFSLKFPPLKLYLKFKELCKRQCKLRQLKGLPFNKLTCRLKGILPCLFTRF